MARLTREEREQIAETRLMRVLGTMTVANQRTLEQKISDAGPFNQRIDPHVLSDVRRRLMAEGRIARVTAANAPWYYAGNTLPEARDARLGELLKVYNPYLRLGKRMGQTLEIAVYRALCQLPDSEFYGRFRNLDAHDDSTMYDKEEPPQHIGSRALHGDERLDFMLRTADAGFLGIECKNVRHWMYPHVDEIKETLRKCLALNAVPVLIARRIPFVTFHILGKCGLIIHQTYNQLLPNADAELAAKVRDKTLLGYHDVRVGNEPDARMVKFITENLPVIARAARGRMEDNADLLERFAFGDMSYVEFAGRVLKRHRGQPEGDGDEIDLSDLE